MFEVRESTPSDMPFLRKMLVQAAYWRPGEIQPDVDLALSRPDLQHVLADWGDHGIRTVCTRDRDFRKFTFLDVRDPFS